MAAPDPNPYESPQSVNTEPLSDSIAPLARFLRRLATLAFTGFASFFTIGLLFVAVNEDASIIWARGVGIFGAITFVSTEAFNSGRGHQAGFLARFVASVAVFLLSVVILAFVGPRPQLRSEETDPYWLQRTLIFAAALVSTFALARLLWLGNRAATDSSSEPI